MQTIKDFSTVCIHKRLLYRSFCLRESAVEENKNEMTADSISETWASNRLLLPSSFEQLNSSLVFNTAAQEGRRERCSIPHVNRSAQHKNDDKENMPTCQLTWELWKAQSLRRLIERWMNTHSRDVQQLKDCQKLDRLTLEWLLGQASETHPVPGPTWQGLLICSDLWVQDKNRMRVPSSLESKDTWTPIPSSFSGRSEGRVFETQGIVKPPSFLLFLYLFSFGGLQFIFLLSGQLQ